MQLVGCDFAYVDTFCDQLLFQPVIELTRGNTISHQPHVATFKTVMCYWDPSLVFKGAHSVLLYGATTLILSCGAASLLASESASLIALVHARAASIISCTCGIWLCTNLVAW